MESDEVTRAAQASLAQCRRRKRLVIGGIVTVVMLALAGLTAQQVFFNTAYAETSPTAMVRYGDACERDDARNCVLIPGKMVEFVAVRCEGSGSTDYHGPILHFDLSVDDVDRIGTGQILVTYKPKPFGIFGSDEVLKIQAMPQQNAPCGPDGF